MRLCGGGFVQQFGLRRVAMSFPEVGSGVCGVCGLP